ncbi:MAG: hypothetical protein ACRCX4_04305 [Bacteroidales bacterium]
MKSFKNIFNKHLFSPAVGFIPIIILILLDLIIGYKQALSVAFLANVIMIGIAIKQFKKLVYNFMVFVSAIVLIILLIISQISNFTDYLFYVPTIIEFTFIIVLLGILFTRKKTLNLLKIILRAQHYLAVKNSFDEFLWLSNILLRIFSLHFIIVIIYELSPLENTELLNRIIYRQLPLYTLVGMYIYEYIRLNMIGKEIKNEEWIPIVNESGAVKGRIARSEMFNDTSDLIFPMVRIALIYDNMLYLYKDPKTHYYNWPINRYVPFGMKMDDFLNKICVENLNEQNPKKIKPKFLMRYLENIGNNKRLVFLYTINLNNEYSKKNKPGMKLWLTSQIEDNVGKRVFTSEFEQEYMLIKNTVMLTDFDSMLGLTEKEKVTS